jgi:mRNA-degrading endonuclease RelE of RelBE toxin-antitoxin system
MAVRPVLTGVVVSKHFLKDLKDQKTAESLVEDVLDCSNVDFTELHKFEMNVDGNLVFRAKKGGAHIVYCVDKKLRVIFLRAFKNYNDYARLLEDKKGIKRMIERS